MIENFSTIIFYILGIIFLITLITFALGGILAAPWLPLWKNDVKRMLKLSGVQKGEKLYDLGAGDGRIIIAAAKDYDAITVGYEIATLPYFIGYIKIILSGLSKKASLRYKNFFKEDLSQADVVCAFLTPPAMAKLKTKLEKELKPGARVVSYAFEIKGWQPKTVDKPSEKVTSIYLYQR